MIILMVCSCTKDDRRIIITEFPINEELNASVLVTDPVIFAPEHLFIFNNQLWLLQRTKEKVFSVFSIPDCKYLYSTVNIGRGPDELLYPIGNTIRVESDSTITLLDNFILKTLKLCDDGNLRVLDSKTIFKQTPINGFIKLCDTLFCAFADCATGSSDAYEYKLMNTNTGKETKFSTYPDLTKKDYDDDIRCQIYYKNLTSNKNKIVAFYSFFKYFRIYDINGLNLEKEIEVKVEPWKTDIENNRKVFYAKPFSTEEYIYVPCFSKEIQIWDWNGTPISKYTLDRHFICYAIDESNNRIYVVSSREDSTDKIYVYDI